MIYGFHIEPMLISAYALFLIGVAGTLEFVARHSHQRSEKNEKNGFIYKRDVDAWQCPTGQYLTHEKTSADRRIKQYRAQAHICNACPRKEDCTDSDDGRRLEMRLDAWIESELRRFHRGISLALLLLSALFLVVEMARFRDLADWIVLAPLLLGITIYGSRYWDAFNNARKPSRFANRERTSDIPKKTLRAIHRFRLLFEADAQRVFRITFQNGDALLLRHFVFIDPSVNEMPDEWSAEIVKAISGAHPDFHKLFHSGSPLDFVESEIAGITDESNDALIYRIKDAKRAA